MQVSATAPASDERDAHSLAKRLGGLLRELVLSPGADHLQLIEERRLSLTQVRALLLLTSVDDRGLAVSAIAERIGLSPAATSRALDVLVRRRLASRREDAADRRCKRLTTTAAGRALSDRLLELRNAKLERFVAGLDPASREALDAALIAIDRAREPSP